MINYLSAQNFRKHEDITINFRRGLNVLRGSNESGKSTILEMVLYALYGAKALRSSLGECVTWGKREADLKVELVIYTGGAEHAFKRSKGGASVSVNGTVTVTGHNEVTAYATDLLGADSKTASLLMLASQSGLRGALDDGPTAVSSLMSKLADFDLIDQILTNASERLLLGSEVPIQEKLAAAQAELVTLKAQSPSEDDWKQHDLDQSAMMEILHSLENSRATTLEPAFRAAEQELAAAEEVRERRVALDTEIAGLEASRAAIQDKLAAAQKAADDRVDPETLARARRLVHDATAAQTLIDLHARFLALPAYPVVFWDEGEEAFQAEMGKQRTEQARLNGLIAAAAAERSALEKHRMVKDTCPACGTVLVDAAKKKAHNDEIDTKIAALNSQQRELTVARDAVNETLRLLEDVDRTARKRAPLTDPLKDHLVYDSSVFPPRVSWNGPAPRPVDVAAQRRDLAALEARDNAAAQAEGMASAHATSLVECKQKMGGKQAELAALPVIDTAPIVARYNETFAALQQAIGNIAAMRLAALELQRQRDEAKRTYDSWVSRQAEVSRRIEEYQGDLKVLAFNNVLVKKLKLIKPAVTDHLWSNVLAAVSNFFSTLRGEKSVVTKDASGFRVNDKDVASLSGSTLDVLALAIRVALTKTFVPHASFLVLDEPAHGADQERTAAILGFLSSVGFPQTLLASHDELSESVADNIVILGV